MFAVDAKSGWWMVLHSRLCFRNKLVDHFTASRGVEILVLLYV